MSPSDPVRGVSVCSEKEVQEVQRVRCDHSKVCSEAFRDESLGDIDLGIDEEKGGEQE